MCDLNKNTKKFFKNDPENIIKHTRMGTHATCDTHAKPRIKESIFLNQRKEKQ